MANWPNWITTQDHIGSQYPFYTNHNKKPLFDLNFTNIITEAKISAPTLEVQSVIEILMRSYIIGDKTLIKGIKRTPWLADFNYESNDWNYFDIPPHSNKVLSPQEAAKVFIELLYEEILSFIGSNKKVGILLSGGMDSRILAGILRKTQINKDFNGEVIAYNWGIAKSRDVWYAKNIAEKFNWNYKYYPLDPDVLRTNFYLVQKVGAETMPYNLHAMDAVAKDKASDIVLAGSYGDTLGRAEYNGTPLKKAPPIVFENTNKLGLLKEQLVADYNENIKRDSISYRKLIDKYTREEFQYRETEYQRHHSRRYLSTAMSIIGMEKPLYQLFTSPKVVKFLWGLDLSLRSDTLYKFMLPLLPEEINEIPWARTGKKFGSKSNKVADKGVPASHEYGTWLRNDLQSFINEQLDFNLLVNLGIFNEKSLEEIYKVWPKTNVPGITKLDTIVSWLTVFSMFIKKYNVKYQSNYKDVFKDKINTFVVPTKMQAYLILKNIKQ